MSKELVEAILEEDYTKADDIFKRIMETFTGAYDFAKYDSEHPDVRIDKDNKFKSGVTNTVRNTILGATTLGGMALGASGLIPADSLHLATDLATMFHPAGLGMAALGVGGSIVGGAIGNRLSRGY